MATMEGAALDESLFSKLVLHTLILLHIPTHTHAHMHTCIHAYMHTCIHAYMHTCTQQRWKRRWRKRGRELSSAWVHAYTGGGGGSGKRAAVAAAERRASGAAAWPWTRRRRWGCPEAQARAPFIRCSARASGPHSAGLRSSLRHARADCPGARLRRLGVRALLRNDSGFFFSEGPTQELLCTSHPM